VNEEPKKAWNLEPVSKLETKRREMKERQSVPAPKTTDIARNTPSEQTVSIIIPENQSNVNEESLSL